MGNFDIIRQIDSEYNLIIKSLACQMGIQILEEGEMRADGEYTFRVLDSGLVKLGYDVFQAFTYTLIKGQPAGVSIDSLTEEEYEKDKEYEEDIEEIVLRLEPEVTIRLSDSLEVSYKRLSSEYLNQITVIESELIRKSGDKYTDDIDKTLLMLKNGAEGYINHLISKVYQLKELIENKSDDILFIHRNHFMKLYTRLGRYGKDIDIEGDTIYIGEYVIEIVKPYVLDYRLTLDGEIYTHREQLEYRVRKKRYRGDLDLKTNYTKRNLEDIVDHYLGRH